MVVRQLHKQDGTKWDCLVHQWLSDNFTNTMGQSETLVHQVFLDNFTNTMWQSETVEYFHGWRRASQTRWGNVRLFSTSRVVRQLHKHDGTMWDCLVPQGLSDNFTNTMEQSETLFLYLKGCQTTSQTRWNEVRLFSTSIVVKQLHQHDGTKWDCLVPQWMSNNFTNTMGQNETV